MPTLAGVLVLYGHLLFDINVVLGKILSLSSCNTSFAGSSIKFLCLWYAPMPALRVRRLTP